MTFKELQKLVQSQLGPEHDELLQRLRQTILDMGPKAGIIIANTFVAIYVAFWNPFVESPAIL